MAWSQLTGLFLALGLSASAWANDCGNLNNERDQELAISRIPAELLVHGKFKNIRGWRNWVMNRRGSVGPDGPYFFSRLTAEANRFREYLDSGMTAAAIKMHNQVAADVLFAKASLDLLRAEMQSQNVTGSSAPFSRKGYEDAILPLERLLGKRISTYQRFASILEAHGSKTAETVQDIVFRSVKEQHRDLIKGDKPPTLESIWDTYSAGTKGMFPNAPYAREKAMMWSEVRNTVGGSLLRLATFGGQQGPLVQALARYLPASKVSGRILFAKRFAKVLNDSMAYGEHYEVMNQFLSPTSSGTKPTPTKVINGLKEAYARFDNGGDLFLVSFFRRTDTARYREKILETAKAENPDGRYYKDLLAAKERADSLGPLASTRGNVSSLELVEFSIQSGLILWGGSETWGAFFGADDDANEASDGANLTADPFRAYQLSDNQEVFVFVAELIEVFTELRADAISGDRQAKELWQQIEGLATDLPETREDLIREYLTQAS